MKKPRTDNIHASIRGNTYRVDPEGVAGAILDRLQVERIWFCAESDVLSGLSIKNGKINATSRSGHSL